MSLRCFFAAFFFAIMGPFASFCELLLLLRLVSLMNMCTTAVWLWNQASRVACVHQFISTNGKAFDFISKRISWAE